MSAEAERFPGSRSDGSGDPPPQVSRFIARFDGRQYWLAHEELEELWQVDRRDELKGLIQIAAAFVHIDRGNWNGAVRLLRTGLRYLREGPESCDGLDLTAIRPLVQAALDRVQELAGEGAAAFDESRRFTLAPYFEGRMPDRLEDIELPYRARRHDDG